MKHEFIILDKGKYYTYETFEEIPLQFDHVISFKPIISDGPHTHEEHDEIGTWNNKLKELMLRERKK